MSHSPQPADGLRAFFERFERLNASPAVEALAQLYAPTLLVAGPGGAQLLASSDLLRAIAKRKAVFDAAGHRQTKLVGCHEHPVTPRFSLVRTDWEWLFESPSKERVTVTLSSTFVVDRYASTPQILVYIPHDDIAAILRQRGLLPMA